MDGEIDAAGLGAQLRQAEGAEAGIDRLVGLTPGPHPHHLRPEGLGPLIDNGPLLVTRVVLRIEFDELHRHLPHAEGRRHAHDVDPHALAATKHSHIVGALLVVTDFVGKRDHHHIPRLPAVAGLIRAGGRGLDRLERLLHARLIDRNRLDRLLDGGYIAVRLADHLGHGVAIGVDQIE